MKFLRDLLDKQKPLFQKGGKLESLYYLYEAGETSMFSPNHTTSIKGAQVKDAIDLKRLMITVVIAMIPCLIFGIYNTGHQHFLAVGEAASFGDKFLLGLQLVLPILIVAYAAGGIVEAVFAVIRKHPINEGFLVTGMLIPLIVPPTIPLWQVALATIFAVVIAKEVFGGTGKNFLNPALTARARETLTTLLAQDWPGFHAAFSPNGVCSRNGLFKRNPRPTPTPAQRCA